MKGPFAPLFLKRSPPLRQTNTRPQVGKHPLFPLRLLRRKFLCICHANVGWGGCAGSRLFGLHVKGWLGWIVEGRPTVSTKRFVPRGHALNVKAMMCPLKIFRYRGEGASCRGVCSVAIASGSTSSPTTLKLEI